MTARQETFNADVFVEVVETTSETAIFERIVLPGQPALGEQAARSLLALDFSADDRHRMDELAEKARQSPRLH